VVLRCLEKEVGRRFQNVGDLVEALLPFSDEDLLPRARTRSSRTPSEGSPSGLRPLPRPTRADASTKPEATGVSLPTSTDPTRRPIVLRELPRAIPSDRPPALVDPPAAVADDPAVTRPERARELAPLSSPILVPAPAPSGLRPLSARSFALLGFLVAVVVAIPLALIAFGPSRVERSESAPITPTPSSETEPTALPPAATEATAVPTSTDPPPAPEPRTSARPVTVAPAKPRADCNPPFTVDANGIKHAKRGCL